MRAEPPHGPGGQRPAPYPPKEAMTAPVIRAEPAPPRPLWVSIEGVNGVGKTTVARSLATTLGERCLLLDELTDRSEETLPGRVTAALAAEGDVYLRTGHPVAETLALLALKVREIERLADRRLPGVDVILEDRGPDSVAVYQAAILAAHYGEEDPARLARYVLATARAWSRLPDATVWLTGDRAVCTDRFAARVGRTLEPRDLDVIHRAEELYRVLAAGEPDRYTVVDTTGLSPQESAEAVEQSVRDLIRTREVAHVA
jgi:dTMP kinase